eukprot:11348232-Prorocentrum_lima.AAC.1
MTSSLVGSEMCIRDSTCTWCRGKHPNQLGIQADSSIPCALKFVQQLAVSYTHLTLPTICSV